MKILPAKAGEGERRAVAFPLPSSLALFSGPPLSKSPCGNRGTVSSRACTRVLVPTNSNLRPVSRASCYLRRLFLYVSRNYDYYRIYTSFPLYTIFHDVSLELSSKRQASYYILEHYLDFISEILERRKATKYHPTQTHTRARTDDRYTSRGLAKGLIHGAARDSVEIDLSKLGERES